MRFLLINYGGHLVKRLFLLTSTHTNQLAVVHTPRRSQHQQQTQILASSSQHLAQNESAAIQASSNHVVNSFQSKLECLEQFKSISERFYADLQKASGMVGGLQHREVIFRFQMHKPSLDVQIRYANLPETKSILEYVDRNLDAFSVKEKAVLFKIFSLMYCHRPKSSSSSSEFEQAQQKTLDKLERDFYEFANSDMLKISKTDQPVSFVDLMNYRDGIFYHR